MPGWERALKCQRQHRKSGVGYLPRGISKGRPRPSTVRNPTRSNYTLHPCQPPQPRNILRRKRGRGHRFPCCPSTNRLGNLSRGSKGRTDRSLPLSFSLYLSSSDADSAALVCSITRVTTSITPSKSTTKLPDAQTDGNILLQLDMKLKAPLLTRGVMLQPGSELHNVVVKIRGSRLLVRNLPHNLYSRHHYFAILTAGQDERP